MRERIVTNLRELAVSLGPASAGSEWHLFGSVERDDQDAEDIDLIIICKSNLQADTLRQAIDPDSLELPLHLSLLTFEEVEQIDAVRVQCSRAIFP